MRQQAPGCIARRPLRTAWIYSGIRSLEPGAAPMPLRGSLKFLGQPKQD